MQTTSAFRSALILALTGYVSQPLSLSAQQNNGFPPQGAYGYPQNPGYSGYQPTPQYQQAPQYQQPQYSSPQYQGGYAAPQSSGYQGQAQGQYVSPMQFLPTFGRRFGEMFRRVFYGDAPPAQPYYGNQGRLDQPPQGGYYQQPQYQPTPGVPGQPRYETAPPRNGSPAMPPTSRMNSGSGKSAPPIKKNSSPSSTTSKKKTVQESPPSNYRPSTISRDTPPAPPPPPTEPSTTVGSSSGKPQQLPGSKPSDAGTSSSSSKSEPSATVSSGSFLRGKKAAKPGRVISPYPPYRELDVTGLASGSLALDPTTQKVFEVP